MQNFESIEDLVAQMFENLDGEDPVSVVADKDLAISIMQELLDYENVILSLAEIDTDYDREYIVSLYDDTDTDYWYVNIEQIYNYEKDKYFGTDGYVLFHEDVNSKALLDMKNNEFFQLSGYDWFVVGVDEETDDTDDENSNCDINIKLISKDEYNDIVSKYTSDKVDKKDVKSVATSKEIFKVNGNEVSKDEYKKVLSDIEDMYLDNMKDMLLRYANFMDDLLKM